MIKNQKSPLLIKKYASQINIDINNDLTFDQFRFLFLKTLDDYLHKTVPLKEFYQLIKELQDLDHVRKPAKPGAEPQPDELIKALVEKSDYLNVLKHEPDLELIKKSPFTTESYPDDEAMGNALKYYKKYISVFKDNYNRFLNLDAPLLNPFRFFQTYADQFNIDIEKPLTHAQFQFLFLKIMDDFLHNRLRIGDFFQYLSTLDFRPHEENPDELLITEIDPRIPSDNRIVRAKSTVANFFTLEEIIEFLSEQSSEKEILAHQPTLELVEKTELTDDDYPYDWPFREALRYYKKNRHILLTYKYE